MAETHIAAHKVVVFIYLIATPSLNGSHRWTSAAMNGVSTEYQFFRESSTAPQRRLRSTCLVS
jgi:hypothetical protein